ncbi:MAG TPA: serine protease, partial [Clostridiales bacterium]|nr:serine protease [Clostridiales bacterium]
AINGEEVASTRELVTKLKKFKAGDTVTITVYRNGDYRDLTVTLDEDKSGAVAS